MLRAHVSIVGIKCQLATVDTLGTRTNLSTLPVESSHQKNIEPSPFRVSDSLDVREALFHGHVPPIVIIPVYKIQSALIEVRPH